ncbi:DsbA family protein [Pelagibacteraceae bacterium]|jgi:protein-disulfide isomerase|nr:DsbA family protein [Pelagibacteraceae bacterium]
MLKIIKNIIVVSFFFLFLQCDQSSETKNSSNSIVVVKVFSSLTCPHCAEFHKKIYKKLEKEYISVGKVKFEHHSFPLDLAALNAEKILQCKVGKPTNFKFLTEIYKQQSKWALGSDANIINDSLKKIGKEFSLAEDQMNKCLADKELEKKILNERIEAQKNYKVSSTPTIYLNEKKYEGKREYNAFKKEIDKIL